MIVHGPTNRHSGDILSGISLANNLQKTGSKADLEPCIFSTNRKPFFPISQIGNINSNSIKKLFEIVTELLRNESALTVRGFTRCNLRESL